MKIELKQQPINNEVFRRLSNQFHYELYSDFNQHLSNWLDDQLNEQLRSQLSRRLWTGWHNPK